MMTRISTLLLGIATLGCLPLVTSFFGLTGKQLATIRALRGYARCKYTYFVDNGKKYNLPWFCVKPDMCLKVWDVYDVRQEFYKDQQTVDVSSCKKHYFHDNHTECCFIGNLKEFAALKSDEWLKMSHMDEEDFWLATENAVNAMFEADAKNGADELELFKQNEVCAFYPVGIQDNSTLYTPHFCVERNQCDFKSPYFKAPPQGSIQQGLLFCDINDFELRIPRKRQHLVCCHPKAIVKNPGNSTWSFRTFPTYALYATGFKSTVQCELYSKYVCQEENDMCAYRILYKNWTDSGAYSLEAYHQAFVGIKKPRAQIFHCQGTIVSRQFILSAARCSEYDHTRANIALMGDYLPHYHREKYSDELYSYIVEHHKLPLGSKHIGDFQRDTYHEDIILFKLWRAMTFSAFRRPACIAANQPSHNLLNWPNDQHHLLFTGYGSQLPGRGWSTTVKKFLLRIEEFDKHKFCQEVFGANDTKDEIADNGEFCGLEPEEEYCKSNDLEIPPPDTRINWGPCKFDLGAPVSILLTVPYCQFFVTGVLTVDPLFCHSQRLHLFRKVERNIMWIEQQIFKDDFDIFGFDLSWPTCDRNNWQFINMSYVRPENNQWSVN